VFLPSFLLLPPFDLVVMSESAGAGQSPYSNIYVAHYYRGRGIDGEILPYHWAIYIAEDPRTRSGYAFQLKGLPPRIYYEASGPHILRGSITLKGFVFVGRMVTARVRSADEVIRGSFLTVRLYISIALTPLANSSSRGSRLITPIHL
jgi:hypothetical protein